MVRAICWVCRRCACGVVIWVRFCLWFVVCARRGRSLVRDTGTPWIGPQEARQRREDRRDVDNTTTKASYLSSPRSYRSPIRSGREGRTKSARGGDGSRSCGWIDCRGTVLASLFSPSRRWA
ncbi:unnamed protein product [Ectocarpus sp. 12 AP-2014]